MTDLRALNDAFAELERRADAAETTFEVPARRRHAPRLVPMAAGLAVVAGLVAGAVVLSRDQGTQTAAPPVTTTSAARPPLTGASGVRDLTPEELADRFRVVLGDLATFEVTETGAGIEVTTVPVEGDGEKAPPVAGSEVPESPRSGAAIGGTLTAGGVTGGFELRIYQDSPEGTAFCLAPGGTCEQRTLPDGTQVAFWQTPFNGAPDSGAYTVNVFHPGGVRLLLHLGNQRSSKGESEMPLTLEQTVAVATSDRW